MVDSPPAPRDSVYHGQRAPNPQETLMRRFDLVLPNSLEDCLKILAERGAQAKLVAGGTDLLPQMKNGALHPAVVVDLSGIARVRQVQNGNEGSRAGEPLVVFLVAPLENPACSLVAGPREASLVIRSGPG